MQQSHDKRTQTSGENTLCSCKFAAQILDSNIFNSPLHFDFQGARRIVSEWPDLDSEASKVTAKILGDDLEPFPSPDQSKDLITEDALKEDMESKAEL